MTINEQHWLESNALILPLPGGDDMPVRRCVVIHFTSGASALSSIEYWKKVAGTKKAASAHIVIDRTGLIYQCRPFNKTTGHAGTSQWRDPKTNVLYKGLNRCSIGIELANAGNDEELARKHSKLPLVKAAHRNGSAVELWEAFPPAQLSKCFALVDALVERYNLDDVTGHDCIAPDRKNDPGPAFPMQELREHCGFRGLPKVIWP
jgi:N-acetylmuramoyl-L-alanine amidase